MTDLLPNPAPTTIDPTTLPSVAPSSPEEALSWLGETVEEVAVGLRARGIKGRRARISQCPIAQYFGQWWSGSWAGPFDIRAGGLIFDTPLHLIEFMGEFDRGAFPDLVDD